MTYSIIARDKKTGELWIWVQTHWFACGSTVPWIEAWIWVIATQAQTEKTYGRDGIKLLEKWFTPKQVYTTLSEHDTGKETRQVAIMDIHGNIETFTGSQCITSAWHFVGDNFSVQANLMKNETIIEAMKTNYERGTKLPLAERILKTLKAAQKAGGDLRWQQSAVIMIVGPNSGDFPTIDIRVDNDTKPLKKLKKLLKIARWYEYINKAEVLTSEWKFEEALECFTKAEKILPDNEEVLFWKIFALEGVEKKDDISNILKKLGEKDTKWMELYKRIK